MLKQTASHPLSVCTLHFTQPQAHKTCDIYCRIVKSQLGNAGLIRDAVPDWTLMPECRCRTEEADCRKKCRCRTNFRPAFRPFTYDFSIWYSKNNTISSCLWTCRVYNFPLPKFGCAWDLDADAQLWVKVRLTVNSDSKKYFFTSLKSEEMSRIRSWIHTKISRIPNTVNRKL
jgi:hypothetical protein